ncbi:MAG: hypothetical protein ABIB61_00740 [Candidatus Shapirobacteria bacterium]
MIISFIAASPPIRRVSLPNRRVNAANMDSDSYKIQGGNVNIGGGEKSSDSYNLTDTIGQIAPGDYQSDGYWLRAGFQYIHSIIPFTFTISDLSIAFGSLVPGTPSTDTNTLNVSAGGAGGYQVLAFENHPLRSEQANDIVDTTCDTLSCDETDADPWINDSIYGFGFKISGDDIPEDFEDSTFFRQFADQEGAESAQIVMSSDAVTSSSTATVTYKVNISGSQAAGNYENAITYIAVPGY